MGDWVLGCDCNVLIELLLPGAAKRPPAFRAQPLGTALEIIRDGSAALQLVTRFSHPGPLLPPAPAPRVMACLGRPTSSPASCCPRVTASRHLRLQHLGSGTCSALWDQALSQRAALEPGLLTFLCTQTTDHPTCGLASSSLPWTQPPPPSPSVGSTLSANESDCTSLSPLAASQSFQNK